ncbi:MAG TPA: phosphodiester glycosidase family protein [Gaiellaceae bacterium]
MPGVTYERGVQFTPHGPVTYHVVRGPRPTGLYALKPVLSNESIQGTERVTSMQKRLSSTATMVGVNADFFAASGRPSGVLMRGGVVESPPFGDRSSVGIAPEGGLDVRRVEFFGTWKGLGQRRALTDLNQVPGTNGVSLFTPSYGQATPAQPGAIEAVIFPFPPTAPNTDLVGPAAELRAGGGTPIPPGGAVLSARGTAAQRLEEEVDIGTTLALRIIFRPEWTGIADAVGGGPVLVRNGGPVFRAQEAFTSSQLSPRNPRTGVGQLADGRIMMVVADGRRPGYSVGMTNFELAQTLVRLGAVTASAFDGGGSTTLAFDGSLLNRPSDPGGERPSSTGLQLMYYGVYSPAPDAVVSPNGDGVAEKQRQLSYKVVRPSTVTATLVGPGGVTAYTESLAREPGTYPVAFPPVPLDPLAKPTPPAEGRWRLDVTAADDLGRNSTTSQPFTVNSTLGFAKLSRRNLVVRVRGKQTINAGVTLTRAARVLATVETASGVQVAAIALRRLTAGRFVATWKGRTRGGRSLAYGGSYVIRFRATNELGTVELTTRAFRVIRAAPVPLKKPKSDR